MALIKIPLPQDVGSNNFIGLIDSVSLSWNVWRGRNPTTLTVAGQATPVADVGMVLVSGAGSGSGTEIVGVQDSQDTVAALLGAGSLRTAALNYAFDGSNWRRQRVDTSGNHLVSVQTALPAGSNLLGSIKLYDSTAVGLLADALQRLRVRPAQGATLTASQLTVTTTPTRLLVANTARIGVLFTLIAGSDCYVGGNNGVAPSGSAGGTPVSVGNAFSDSSYTGDWYAVCASGTTLVATLEVSG